MMKIDDNTTLPDEVFISVDVETSGPVPGLYALLSIGACVVDQEDKTFYIELCPPDKALILPGAVAATGIDMDRLRKEGVDPAVAAAEFASWICQVSGDIRPVFAAFNAPFDWPFVNDLFVRIGVDNPFGYTALDMKAFYMGLSGCSWDETRSSRLPEALQPSPVREHHALDDAVAQAMVFGKMLNYSRSARTYFPNQNI